ncbi:MAG TPA: hybrid sensor histidine kinase/response regulator, partial [Oxalobacteraceae bacterium]|nr:hybrid sensor histidine kinase/response regulator [Oxalobacteraceae bacterium]
VERLVLIGFAMTLTVLLLVGGIALDYAVQSVAAIKVIEASVVLLLAFLALLYVRIRRVTDGRLEVEHAGPDTRQPLLKAGALQNSIFNSANFSSIATDAQGVIQIFN